MASHSNGWLWESVSGKVAPNEKIKDQGVADSCEWIVTITHAADEAGPMDNYKKLLPVQNAVSVAPLAQNNVSGNTVLMDHY